MLLSRVKCLPSKTIDWSQLCKTGLSLKSSQLDGLVYYLNYFQRATTEIWSVGPFEITCLFSYAYLLFLKYTHNPHANRYSGTWRATPHVITTLNSVCPPSACLVKQGVCVCVCVCVRACVWGTVESVVSELPEAKLDTLGLRQSWWFICKMSS